MYVEPPIHLVCMKTPSHTHQMYIEHTHTPQLIFYLLTPTGGLQLNFDINYPEIA